MNGVDSQETFYHLNEIASAFNLNINFQTIILLEKIMETFKAKTIIKKNHKIELEGLPFENVELVEVVISSKETVTAKKYNLRGALQK